MRHLNAEPAEPTPGDAYILSAAGQGPSGKPSPNATSPFGTMAPGRPTRRNPARRRVSLTKDYRPFHRRRLDRHCSSLCRKPFDQRRLPPMAARADAHPARTCRNSGRYGGSPGAYPDRTGTEPRHHTGSKWNGPHARFPPACAATGATSSGGGPSRKGAGNHRRPGRGRRCRLARSFRLVRASSHLQRSLCRYGHRLRSVFCLRRRALRCNADRSALVNKRTEYSRRG